MTRFQRLASIVSVLAVTGLGATAVAYAAPQAAQAGEVGEGHHRHHGHGDDLVRAALHLDSLSASQRQQVEQLAAGEKTAHANVHVAGRQLMQAVAAGVAAGNVSDAAIAPQVQAVEGAMAGDEPGDRASLEKLHAILTPAQRAELVGRIEARSARMRERFEEGRASHGGDGGKAEGAERMGPWAHMLSLTQAQRDQIKANLASTKPADTGALRAAARAEHQRVLEAFKGDRFVMNEIAAPRDPRLVDERVEGMVRLAKAAAPVLTADQRAAVAAKLQEMATRQNRPH